MSDDDTKPAPEKSLADIQLSLARVAFRLAQTTEIIIDLLPKSILTLDDKQIRTREDLSRISKEMMELAGDLLGMDKEDE